MNSPTGSAAKAPEGILPLVIGITGHRDLREEDLPALEDTVRGILRDLRARYPNTPLLLLSALAEGADQLAARVALDERERGEPIQLVAPLPMPRASYQEDFKSDASREEFERLLQEADAWFEMSLVDDNTLDGIREHLEQRNRQYAQVGAYIVDHCQILIALWDGVDTKMEGGTAQVVRFKLQGVPAKYAPPHSQRSPLDTLGSGPVYQIVTPRQSNPLPTGKPGFRISHYSVGTIESARGRDSGRADGGGEEVATVSAGASASDAQRTPDAESEDRAAQVAFERSYERMEVFNRDALDLGARLAAARERSEQYLIQTRDRSALPDTAHRIVEKYTLADGLAQHFRGKMVRALYDLAACIFSLWFLFNLYSNPLPHKPQILLGSSLGWCVLFWMWHQSAHQGDYQNKFQDYRALAEGLRVQFFWRLAGLPDSAADHYLRKQRSELDWIQNAIQAWSIGSDHEYRTAVSNGEADRTRRVQQVLECWVQDQRDWFASRAGREQRKHNRLDRWSQGLILVFLASGAALGAVLTLMMATASQPAEKWQKGVGPWPAWCIVVLSMLPIMAALIHGYVDKMGLAEHSNEYQRMSLLFANGAKRLSEALAAGNQEGAERLLRELGKEALMENGNWVLLHRQRPLEASVS